jgi:hypothetical protein
MIDLKYALTIEATEDPTFFSFYSTELEGFAGVVGNDRARESAGRTGIAGSSSESESTRHY